MSNNSDKRSKEIKKTPIKINIEKKMILFFDENIYNLLSL